MRPVNGYKQAALEADRCTLDRVENDECVPNGFFVRETAKRMTLSVAADARVDVYARTPEGAMKSDEQGNIYLEATTPAALADLLMRLSSLKSVPFVLTTTHGVITKIQEQYVP